MKLLIIDDDKLIRSSLAHDLRSCDAELVFAQSGEEALTLLESDQYGVIVCDQDLPGMNGCELLMRARELQPQTVRIMLTGYTDLEQAISAVNKGRVSSFLLKPWDSHRLRGVVHEAMETHRQWSEQAAESERLRHQRDDLANWTRNLESIAHDRAQALMQAYDETLSALVMALDTREQETAGHSRRVSVLSLYLALQLGLDHEYIEPIYRGALLHDIGKIGIADAILLKPGRLDPYEREVIERHTKIGEAFIEGIGYLEPVRELVRSHHEKYDGSGYPDGLRGEDIPLGARIFAVIDVFDALRSERPYKSALSYDASCAIIRESLGTHFDPEIGELFLSIPRATIERLCAAALEADTFSSALVVCGRFLRERAKPTSVKAA